MSQSPVKFELSRRTFLGFSLAAAGSLLIDCSSGGPSGPVVGGAGDDPFELWDQLRTAVRASPDHLAAATDRLVAARDARGLFELVRDRIASYPPTGLDGAVTEVRWGVRGTLRGGAGTPREKAELLAALYRRAGFDAQVVVGSIAARLRSDAAARAYLRPVVRQFAPAVDAATLTAWQAALAKVGTLGAVAPIDADDRERRALVDAIGALVPADAAARMGPYDATLDTAAIETLPLVAVTIDGAIRFANPLFAEARFGDSLTDDDPVPAPDPDPAPMVVIELAVSTTAAPTRRIAVARASYPADQLAGRQVLAQFAPATDIDTLARLRVADVHAWKPVLSVRGPDVEPDADPGFVVIGSEVTLRGDVIETAADGTIALNGRTLFAPAELDPAAAARVAGLAVEVAAGGFPSVRLAVSALDAAGRAVGGLGAPAFELREGGAPVGTVLGATPAESVRVFLDFDLDGPLATGEDPLEFARQLTRAVTTAYPGAVIVTGVDGDYVELTSPDAVAGAVGGGDSDDPWADLAAAAGARPMLTVVVSDFEGLTDPRDPASPKGAYRALVAGGPPVVAIATDPAPSADVAGLAALTGGVAVLGGGIADGIAAVLDRLAARRTGGGSYTLSYAAPLDGPARRDLTLVVNGHAVAASYAVPAVGARAEQTALAGVYLTVSLGDRTVTRVLGGYASDAPPADGVPVAQAVLDDVVDALFGVSLLSFEAAAPPLSVALDDALSIKLAARPLWQAVARKDSAAIRANLAGLRTFVPAELTMLQCAPRSSSAQSLTYEDGLRIVRFSHRPRFAGAARGGSERRLDILPLAGWASLSASATTSFRDTLARSARVAVVEGHALDTSTLRALAGVPLRLLPPGDVDAADLPYGAAASAAAEALDRFDGYYRLVPDAGQFAGFWAVSAETGSVLGVLPDGTGGASQSEECQTLSQLNNAFSALGLVAGFAGMGGLGPYFWLGMEVASVALLSAAILDNQEVGNPDPNAPLDGLAENAACEAAKLGVTAGASASGTPVGDAIGDADTANTIAGLAGGGLNCPSALAGVGCS